MSTLLLTLAGPMQSWGVADRHARRGTMPCPTMSGVCGLIAACLGLEHGADLAAEFDGVRFSVREDERPGRLSDFQTVGAGTKTAKVVVKDYLTGAAYTAALEADRPRLERWAEALRHPAHAVGLGRRGCPPSRPFAPRIEDAPAAGLFAGSHWWTGSPRGDAWVDAPVRRDGNGGVWNIRAVAEHGGDFFDGI